MSKILFLYLVLLNLLLTSNALAPSLKDDFSKCYREPEAMYVHIPFCRRRCFYCDFSIVPVGDKRDKQGENDSFTNMAETYSTAVQKEIKILNESYYQRRPRISPLRSLYFGGGTPSIAPFNIIRDILQSIRGSFPIADNAEITIEMDPGTFSREYLSNLVSIGFNRVSLGVQSFDDSILESIGRVHRSVDVYSTIEILKEEGIRNFSIDLISGLPGLTQVKWIETLDIATSLNPSHISCYDLQIEETTAFYKWFGSSEVNNDTVAIAPKVQQTGKHLGMLPSADDVAFMYKYASGYLKNKGFEHYEISSYSQPGFRSNHNKLYWDVGASWFGK